MGQLHAAVAPLALGLVIAYSMQTHPAAAEGDDMRLQIDLSKILSERGSTRATRYAVTNKIVTLQEGTHVAWLDSISETMVATYDHADGRWGDPVRVGSGKDNHGGPALLADSEGYLHIFFGPHHGPLQHAVSARPDDSGEWIAQDAFGIDATYPSAVCDDRDTLHIIYRGGEAAAKRLVYQRKPEGRPWSDLTELAAAPIESGYTHFHSALTIAPDQSLHVSYDIYYNGAAKCAGHLVSRDRGDTWTLAGGSTVTLPVTPERDAFFKRSDTSLGTYSVVCDSHSRPWISVSGLELWHHDGSAWRTIRPAETAGIPQEEAAHAGGTLAIDSRDRLYWFGPIEGSLFVLYSDDGAQSFQRLPIAAPEPDRPLMGPSVERPTGHNRVGVPWLLYSAGEKGPDCYGHGIHHRVTAVKLVWRQPGQQ